MLWGLGIHFLLFGLFLLIHFLFGSSGSGKGIIGFSWLISSDGISHSFSSSGDVGFIGGLIIGDSSSVINSSVSSSIIIGISYSISSGVGGYTGSSLLGYSEDISHSDSSSEFIGGFTIGGNTSGAGYSSIISSNISSSPIIISCSYSSIISS